MKDGYGDPVNMAEDEDLLYLSKSTFCRVGHDLYNSAIQTAGVSWQDIWTSLTGEEVPTRTIHTISALPKPIDFLE